MINLQLIINEILVYSSWYNCSLSKIKISSLKFWIYFWCTKDQRTNKAHFSKELSRESLLFDYKIELTQLWRKNKWLLAISESELFDPQCSTSLNFDKVIVTIKYLVSIVSVLPYKYNWIHWRFELKNRFFIFTYHYTQKNILIGSKIQPKNKWKEWEYI